MGCNLNAYKLSPKIKTIEAVRKWYKDVVEQDQYENGHGGYSGTIGSTHGLRFMNDSYELLEDAEERYDFIEKGMVEVFQVKVFNEDMATLAKWRSEVERIVRLVNSSGQAARIYPESRASHLLVQKRATKDLVRARKRYTELRRNAAARSKKFQYMVVVACPE